MSIQQTISPGFSPVTDMCPGEVGESIDPLEWEDWKEAFNAYMLTGTPNGQSPPEELKVAIFQSRLDPHWRARLRDEIRKSSSWATVVRVMDKVLLSTHPLFSRRTNAFSLRQKPAQLFSEFIRAQMQAFSQADIAHMSTEEIRMHLALSSMQGGKLRDKLFAEKDLTPPRMMELTSLFEEAEIKKSQGTQRAKKTGDTKNQGSAQGKGPGDFKCYHCGEPGHRRPECPTLPRCSWCNKPNHTERECRGKLRGDPKAAGSSQSARKSEA
jgi:hypothetical protein